MSILGIYDKVPNLFMTRFGQMFCHPNDNCIGRSLREYGEWAQLELDIILPMILPGQLVLDVGANIGTHSIPFSSRVGKGGAVIAFEPQHRVCQFLCSNVIVNDAFNVHTRNMAVGDRCSVVLADNLDFGCSGNHGGAKIYSATESSNSRYPVQMITIDSLMLPACDFIKADIEGWETDMIVGANNTISRYKPIMYLGWHDSETLVPLVKSYGYEVFEHNTTAFNHDNLNHKSEDIFNGYVERNILCVPKERKFETSLKRRL